MLTLGRVVTSPLEFQGANEKIKWFESSSVLSEYWIAKIVSL
jgi:hypothetical protein